jgi:hypothetical protein
MSKSRIFLKVSEHEMLLKICGGGGGLGGFVILEIEADIANCIFLAHAECAELLFKKAVHLLKMFMDAC